MDVIYSRARACQKLNELRFCYKNLDMHRDDWTRVLERRPSHYVQARRHE